MSDFDIKPKTFDEFYDGFMTEDACASTREEAIKTVIRRAYDEGRFAGLQEGVKAWSSRDPLAWGDYTLSVVRAKAAVSRQRRGKMEVDR